MLKPSHRYWANDENVAVEFDNDVKPAYRYILECIRDEQGKIVTFIMLNPSIANSNILDVWPLLRIGGLEV